MTIREMRDARNKLLTEAQQILLASPDAEKRAFAQKMLAEVDLLEADITSLEKIEKSQAEERAHNTPPRGNPDGGLKDPSKEEAEAEKARSKKAFEQYIRTGQVDPELRSALREHRDVTTSVAGNLIPQAFLPILTEAMKDYGNILNVVNNVPADNGAPTKYAVVDDTANGLVVLGEDTAAAETDPSFSGGIISSDFMSTGVIKVSIATLQASAFDMDSFLKQSILKRYFRGLSKMVTLGNTSNVASIVASAAAGVTSAAPTAIAWSDIAGLYASLDPAYESNAVWSMATVTRGVLLTVNDSLGRPLYVHAPSADVFDMILGKRVVVNPFMAAVAATNITLLYGDHSQYVLRNVKPGISIVRLNERFMDSGDGGFIGFARAGGALLQGSVAPVVKLTQHA